MPGEPSLPAIPRFLEAAPGTAVVMLTMQAEPAYAREALSARGERLRREDLGRGRPRRGGPGGRGGRHLPDARARREPRAAMCAARRRRRRRPRPGTRSPSAATSFAGHRVDGVAGRGAMGVVLRATDLVLDRAVALKLHRADPTPATRCSARASSASAASPRASTTRTSSRSSARARRAGALYVTMRYVDGTDLKSLIARERRLEPGARRRARRAGRGRARRRPPARPRPPRREAREHPRRVARGRRARVPDRLRHLKQRTETPDTALTGAGMALGSVDYMAPEQAQVRDLDARTDVYALGCVLFHALTGSVPFIRGNDFERMWAHVHEPPPAVSSIEPRLPAALDPVLARALAKAPDDRQQSAGAFAREARAARRRLSRRGPAAQGERAAGPRGMLGRGRRGDGRRGWWGATAVRFEAAGGATPAVLCLEENSDGRRGRGHRWFRTIACRFPQLSGPLTRTRVLGPRTRPHRLRRARTPAASAVRNC